MMTLLSNKYSIVPVMVLMFAAPQIAFAQSPSPLSGPLSTLYACEQLVGDAAQLSCFRAATAKIRASDSVSSSLSEEKEGLAIERERLAIERQDLAVEKERLSKAKKPLFNDDFGKKSKGPKSQSVAITKAVTLKVSGYTLFTLENGEVWQQTESGRVRLGRASPDVLVIKKRSFGGFLGKVNDKRPAFSVKRVR